MATYKYNRGGETLLLAFWCSSSGNQVLGCLMFALGSAPIVAPLRYAAGYDEQRAEIDVTYGPDDTVVGVLPGATPELRELKWLAEQGDAEAQQAFDDRVLRRLAQYTEEELRPLAELGNGEAHSKLVQLLSQKNRRAELKSLAEQGDVEAQYRLA